MNTTTVEQYPFPLSRRNRFPSETTADGRYDRSRARQYWHDPQALNGHQPNDRYPIHVVDEHGNYTVACTISCGQAAIANIDGIPPFPQAAVGPSGVTQTMMGGTIAVEPSDLIRTPDAQALIERIRQDTGTVCTLQDVPVNGAGEWHLYNVLPSGQNAGELWAQQNLFGVGYPGKWNVAPGGNWLSFTWADQSIYAPDPNAHFPFDPVPFPMDPLNSGEFLIDSPNPMSIEKWVQYKQPDASDGGMLLAQIANDTAAIRADLARIKSRLGISAA